ncbi:hypothetical protein [Photorhabdus sp. RM71S]|uniref:hypothetical protein n=1 Tax=Photorhabdus sp. RM71S TaxID=3342824 RepID=UPI0036DCDB78
MCFIKISNVKHKISNAVITDISPYCCIAKISVNTLNHIPGQYISLSCKDGPERFFSVVSHSPKGDDSSELSILISFTEKQSPSYKIIEKLKAKKEIFLSGPFGDAYFRDSEFGSVLISCDYGVAYINGIVNGLKKTLILKIIY